MDGLDRRQLLRLLAGAGAAGVTGGLAACSATPVSTPKSQVRLGLLVPATGANKSIGADLENGFKLYLETHGDMLSGHPVDLLTEDEGDTVDQGSAALKKLHDSGVVSVVGVANPDLLPAIRDTVEKSQVPLIAAHGCSSEMASAVYIWRTAYLNNEPGRAAATHLKGKGKVALVGLQDSFGKDVMGGFTGVYSNTTDTIWVQPTGNPDRGHLSSAVSRALNSAPAAIFCYLPAAYLVHFMDGVRDASADLPVYAPGVVSEGLALEQLSQARGLYTVMQYSADLNNAANRAFSSLFQTRFSRSPTAYAVAAYDAAAVLDRAIALVGDDSVTSQRVNLEIANVGQVVSPRGNWQFTQARAPQQKWYLRQIRMDGPMLSNVLVSELTTLA